MARIEYPDAQNLTSEMRDHFARLEPLNITRMMSHNERVLAGVSRLGSELLGRGTLPPVLRELVILRIGQLCDCAYEKHQHLILARELGVPEAKLVALESGNIGAFSTEERLAMRFAEELHGSGAACEATFRRCSESFSRGQLVELCILAGFYIMIASFLGTFDVEIESKSTDYRPGSLGQSLGGPHDTSA